MKKVNPLDTVLKLIEEQKQKHNISFCEALKKINTKNMKAPELQEFRKLSFDCRKKAEWDKLVSTDEFI